MLIKPVANKVIISSGLQAEIDKEQKRKEDIEFVKLARKMTKKLEKEILAGKVLKCESCGVRAGTKTRLGDKYVGVTIKKTDNGYRCQLCV